MNGRQEKIIYLELYVIVKYDILIQNTIFFTCGTNFLRPKAKYDGSSTTDPAESMAEVTCFHSFFAFRSF